MKNVRVQCITPKCRTLIELTKEDLRFRESTDSMFGIGTFGKLCKKHELEMIKRHEVKV